MTLAKGAANQLRPGAEGGWGPPEHLPGYLPASLPPCPAVALGIFSQNPVSMAPPWGRSPLGGAKGDAGQCRFEDGQGAGSSPLSSVSGGRPGPSHALPGMQGCSGELNESVTFPLESEVSQSPRLASILDKEPKQARGEGLGPVQRPGSPHHLIAPHFHSLWVGGVATAKNSTLREGDVETRDLLFGSPGLVTCRGCQQCPEPTP